MTSDLDWPILALQAALGAGVGLAFMLWLRRSVERAARAARTPATLLLGAALRVGLATAALWLVAAGSAAGALAAVLGFGLGRWAAARGLRVGAAR